MQIPDTQKLRETDFYELVLKELRTMIVEETANEVAALENLGRRGSEGYREAANAARAAYDSPELVGRLAKLMAYEEGKAYAAAAAVYEEEEREEAEANGQFGVGA